MELLALLFCGWIVSVLVTSQTRAWWVPRVIPAILGLISLAMIEDTRGDVGGIQALANGVAMIAGLILLGLSAITLGFRLVFGSRGAPASGLLHPPAVPPAVPPAIPPAYVITPGDRSVDD